MKKIIVICCLVLIFTLAACSSNKSNEPVDSKAIVPSIGDTEGLVTKTPVEHEDPDDVYQPEKALPEGLPVYPGAVMTFDTETAAFNEGLHWMWMYEDAGSAKEIHDFFVAELEKLGFELEEPFFSEYEVFVHDVTGTVSLGFSADENDDLNKLGYMITVNLDAWNER
ncbi:MAG TPA: hypothetical protein PK646_02710 [Bacillota bacterium]|jgi:hypothetical protein|nr:hypothetical protein [Fastidiosipila sp.]HPX93324.1 hypothetical protein [Bacillota bacterium]HQB80983.1 hypothetical protein [Bacillota bacterium]